MDRRVVLATRVGDEGVRPWASWCDRIPEIIHANGRIAATRVLEGRDYEVALLDKLVEESSELRDAEPGARLEEAADVYEVLLAVAEYLDVTMDDIARCAADKRVERGGFTQRLWLEI